jgi:3'-phosphoadenosine 5'-phosphosulfate sulfotransferase (PAPS reductase)/FAD synthetase
VIHNFVSVSGGKDSTATLLLAFALETENLQAVFADTGHEHAQTYEYIEYLERRLGLSIKRVKADLSADIARKRNVVAVKWEKDGVPESIRSAALSVLHPTGNPFLDMCLVKGRFPSSQVRFCTDMLKRDPIINDVFSPLMYGKDMVVSWQGVRSDESPNRRFLPECDEVGGGLFNYRPILRWPVDAVFEAHRYMGVKPNPLYSQGMGRVGCMPCVMCRKDELSEIAKRFPDEVARVREWERLVSIASKRGSSTFFKATNDPTVSADDAIDSATHGIDRMIEWATTDRGGRQFVLGIDDDKGGKCSSAYGLCE